MNFDLDPRNKVALDGAEAVCTDVLPGLSKEPSGFFRDAYRALAARRLLEEESLEVAARVAMRLAAASGSLAVVFASGFGFTRALRLGETRATPENLGAQDGVIGVLDLGTSLTAPADARPTLRGESPLVIGGPVATHAIVVTAAAAQAIARVDLEDPGVSRAPAGGALAFDSVPVCALRFDDVATHAVVSDGAGRAILQLLNMRRILDGAIGVGIGRHAFRVAVEHLRSLEKRPSQTTEFSLSDVATELDAAELSVLRAAWTVDHGSARALESSSARLVATRAATHAAHTALVLTGSTSYTTDLRQCYLEACALEFQSETSAMQVATIASEMLEES